MEMEMYLKNDKGEYLSRTKEFSSTPVLWKIAKVRQHTCAFFTLNDNGVYEYQTVCDWLNYETIENEQPLQYSRNSIDGFLGVSLGFKIFCFVGANSLSDAILLLCEFPTYKRELK